MLSEPLRGEAPCVGATTLGPGVDGNKVKEGKGGKSAGAQGHPAAAANPVADDKW